MNSVVLLGRLTSSPESRYTNAENPVCIANYTLAVDRRYGGGTDFIRCTAFGKAGEFADKWFKKGMQVCVRGSIRTGSYKRADGTTVYTTEVAVDEQNFAEKKRNDDEKEEQKSKDQFIEIPDNLEEEMPFL